jgi:hypothetical protein
MRRTAASIVLALLPCWTPLAAQAWQSGRDNDLIARATEARFRRDADSVLSGWQASARGMVRFTAEIDHGNGPIERVIRADELRVEVYGEAPNRSKQVITAWRDTTFQPTNIVYHRDHLGIVAHDFGPVIRLGEGEEVRDVPHPLSAAGREWYEFAIADSLEVAAPTGRVRVVVVRVRPRDPEGPGIVGSMLIDTDRAALVQLAFTFTAASYRDATVAEISVRLQNALHESQRWLPWRQAIAIRRATPALVLPFATIIRADWIIDDYQLGLRHPADRFRGMSIDGPLRPPPDSLWTEPWLETPDVPNPTSVRQLDAVGQVAAEAVSQRLLEGLPQTRLLATGGVSQLLRVNRVQGATIGAGFRWEPQPLRLDVAGAFGTSDGRLTGTATLSRKFGAWRVFVAKGKEVRDMHAWQRRSGVANSMATLIDGSDAGDWYLSHREEVGVEIQAAPRLVARYALRQERVEAITSAFTSLNGMRIPNPQFAGYSGEVLQGDVAMTTSDGRGLWVSVESGRAGSTGYWRRVAFDLRGDLPAGIEGRLRLGAADRNVPAHRAFVVGGAGSLPGTVTRSIGGRQVLLAELARPWRIGVPAPVGSRMTGNTLNSRVAPFVAVGVARQPLEGTPWPATGRLVPVLGARLDLWGPLLRLEVGWAPRTGGVSFMFDAHPDWWPLL